MAIEMIDIELAKFVMNQIKIGDSVEIELDGVKHTWPIVGLTSYSVDLKTPSNRLCVPVECLTLYQTAKGTEEMARSALPPGVAPRGRGRPPKEAASAAPVDAPRDPNAPAGGWLPPGSPYATAPIPGQPQQAWGDMPQGWQQSPIELAPFNPHVETKPELSTIVTDVVINDDWIEETINNIADNMATELKTLVEGMQNQFAANLAEKPKIETDPNSCSACLHVDIANNKCGLYNITPPMEVIFNPKQECKDYEFIPF